MSDIQVIRQLLLDLLTEYQELEKPANPELLKLHIEAYEDRFEALIQEQVRQTQVKCAAELSILDQEITSLKAKLLARDQEILNLKALKGEK